MHLLRNVHHCRLALLFALIPARLTLAQTSCTDDTAFQFVTTNSDKTVKCAWLNMNKKHSAKRISMYCGEPSIKDACSASCGACGRAGTCEDTNGFMFELNNGNDVGCEWFTKNNTAKRTRRYCVESGSFFDAKIADGCVASCGLCEDDAPSSTAAPVTSAPASNPTSSCQDTNGFKFELNNGNDVGCEWFTKNNTAQRTRRYCVESGPSFNADIADGCVASCGLCEDDAPSSTAAPVTSAPASNPTSSCQDTNEFIFELDNGNDVGCEWFTKNKTAQRTRRYCVESGFSFDPEIADGCVASCGLCGESTTSPTQGPTAAPVPTPRTTPKPAQGPTASPVSTPKRTPLPTQGPTAAPVRTPKRTPVPTQGPTTAPVTSPRTTPKPTQGPTAAPTTICPDGVSPFTITLMNMGSNTNFDAAFASAKAKWESIIKCDLQDIARQSSPSDFDWFGGTFKPKSFNGDVDDVVIGFSIEFIDGANGVLGFAGAVFLRTGPPGSSPISGIMKFDEDDFDTISQNDAEIIILHEMGHILGLVNLEFSACHSSCDSGNFDYGGTSGCSLASDEYNALELGVGNLKVENNGGGGTKCSHWEEESFPRLKTGNDWVF